jgi:stage V sporulation protein B
MVGSVVFMPSVFSISLGASLVPAISESIARKDMGSIRKKTDLGIRVSMIIGLPAACGLFILAEPIMRLLYGAESEFLGMLTRYMAPAIVVLTLVQTLTAILQGMGKERVPVKNLAIGAVVKLFLSYYLVSIPYINIKGVAIATIIGYTIPALLNLGAIVKCQKENFDYVKIFVKPAIASGAMTITAYFVYKAVYSVILKNSIAVLLSIALAAVVYGVVLIAVKGITIEELQFAPGGNKLSKALKKRGVK